MSKSLITSKTFWLNLLGVGATLLGSGIVPPKYSVPALGVLNIINRLFTDSSIGSLF